MNAGVLFIFLGLSVVYGLVNYENFALHLDYLVGWLIVVLAICAWIMITVKRKNEKTTILDAAYEKVKSEKIKIGDLEMGDEEFHNDFSKVPAGVPDPIQPLPRSIGYGYGDGGKSLDEDLERISKNIEKDKNQ